MTHRPGVDLTLAELMALRTANRRAVNRPQTALQSGAQVANKPVSRGLDVSEIRRYQAGDEVRAIDWKVTARRGETHVKVFEDERAKSVYLFVDLRGAMRFGTRVCLKSVLAARLAAAIGWAACAAGDRVGAWIVTDSGVERLPDGSHDRAVRRLCHALVRNHASPVGEETIALDAATEGVSRGVLGKAEWHFISDFKDAPPEFTALGRITAVCWHVTDPFDSALPERAGWVSGPDGVHRLSTRPRDRRDYALRHDERVGRLQQVFRGPSRRYCQISTADGDGTALHRALAGGARR